MDAFEKYYHEEIDTHENSNPPVKGKDANRKRELEFLTNVTEFRSASVNGTAINGNTLFVIWNYDYTHKERGSEITNRSLFRIGGMEKLSSNNSSMETNHDESENR